MFVKASSEDSSFLSQYPQPLAPNYHGHPFLAVNFYKMIGLLVLSKYRNEKHIYIFSSTSKSIHCLYQSIHLLFKNGSVIINSRISFPQNLIKFKISSQPYKIW